MRRLEADVWCLQEAYPSQVSYVEGHGFGAAEWSVAGRGRNTGGGGEATAIVARSKVLDHIDEVTRWFGPTPDQEGSRSPGASHPRIATMARYGCADGSPLAIVNLHLGSVSVDRRADSLVQLAGWLEPLMADAPTIVAGDFNGPLTEPGFAVLRDLGFTSVLESDAGSTSNGFGRRPEEQGQIDHIFVTPNIRVRSATVDRSTEFVSDHYPVIADLEFS